MTPRGIGSLQANKPYIETSILNTNAVAHSRRILLEVLQFQQSDGTDSVLSELC